MKDKEFKRKIDEWVKKKAEEEGLSEELIRFALAPQIVAVKDFIDWVTMTEEDKIEVLEKELREISGDLDSRIRDIESRLQDIEEMFEEFRNFLIMELTAQQSDLTKEEAMEIAEKINKGIYKRIIREEEEKEGEE